MKARGSPDLGDWVWRLKETGESRRIPSLSLGSYLDSHVIHQTRNYEKELMRKKDGELSSEHVDRKSVV